MIAGPRPVTPLVVVEGGPHGLTLTHADLVSRELIRFIESSAKVPA